MLPAEDLRQGGGSTSVPCDPQCLLGGAGAAHKPPALEENPYGKGNFSTAMVGKWGKCFPLLCPLDCSHGNKDGGRQGRLPLSQISHSHRPH